MPFNPSASSHHMRWEWKKPNVYACVVLQDCFMNCVDVFGVRRITMSQESMCLRMCQVTEKKMLPVRNDGS